MGRLPSLRTCQASHKDGPTISKPDLLQSMVKEVLKSRKSPIACTEKHGEQLFVPFAGLFFSSIS